MLVSGVISEVLFEILDEGNVAFTRPRMLGFFNDAVLQLATVRCDLFATIVPMKLTPNSVRQALPENTIVLVSVMSNLGPDGATPGPVITFADKATLDTTYPSWHSDRSTIIKHYLSDTMMNNMFYVWPGPTAGTDVWVETWSVPRPDVYVEADNPLGFDLYKNQIKHYMKFLAYSKEIDDPKSAEKMNLYEKMFYEEVGLSSQAIAAITPR